MSNLVKQSEPRVLWTIGNTQIVDSETDQGIVPLFKIAVLGIAAVTVAPVSPVIAIAFAGYGAMKILDLATAIGKDGADIAANIYDDVNGDAPDNWVPMPQPREHQPMRITTQLGEQSAIDVSAQAVQTQTAIDPTQQMRTICDRNNSFYIAGSKGSGKGMFAANLLRWKLDQYPNAIALILDPKDDAKEAGYWEHPRIKRFAFKGIALSKAAYAVKVAEFLAEARNLVSQADITRGMRLFLTFDELLTLKTKLDKPLFDELSSFGAEAISTGDSAGIHVIAITQSFNAGDSFGSDEVLKNFTQIGLFREDEFMRAKKLIQYGRSNTDSFTTAEFNALIEQSPVRRVMSIAGEFIPTPRLENYSAYDRDSGKVIRPMPLGSNPSEGDRLAEQLKTEVAKRIAPTEAITQHSPDRFEQLSSLLTHESQANLKSFVLWLRERKGQEITFDHIKDNWARRAGLSRSKEAIEPFIQIAIVQKLIDILPNNNWQVRDS